MARIRGLYSRSSTVRKSRSPLPPRRSAPEQKPRPSPVRITARTASSRAIPFRAASSSRRIWLFKAFSDSGRLRVSVATPSATSLRMVGGVSWAMGRF